MSPYIFWCNPSLQKARRSQKISFIPFLKLMPNSILIFFVDVSFDELKQQCTADFGLRQANPLLFFYAKLTVLRLRIHINQTVVKVVSIFSSHPERERCSLHHTCWPTAEQSHQQMCYFPFVWDLFANVCAGVEVFFFLNMCYQKQKLLRLQQEPASVGSWSKTLLALWFMYR